MKRVAVTLMVLVAMVQFMAMPNEARRVISCVQVSAALSPCISYLTSGGGAPSSNCCSGVKNLAAGISTRVDRQAACNCIKDAASRIPSIKPDAASNLPGKCGVQLNVPISATTNCASIP